MEYILAVKIPAFVSSNPALWYGMLESTFELAVPKPVTDERTKYNYCVTHLSLDAAMAVRDQLLPNVQSILASIQPLTDQKASDVADRILKVTPVQVSSASKYSSASADDSSESKLLNELKHLRQRSRSPEFGLLVLPTRGKSPKDMSQDSECQTFPILPLVQPVRAPSNCEAFDDPSRWHKEYERVTKFNRWDDTMCLANACFSLKGIARL
ncbi:uncharacterized protein TNCV_4679331 [Trichonephila clavipes]|nr:uncharacterized protein TNCV_4679331 [Trichonephila clavipes]